MPEKREVHLESSPRTLGKSSVTTHLFQTLEFQPMIRYCRLFPWVALVRFRPKIWHTAFVHAFRGDELPTCHCFSRFFRCSNSHRTHRAVNPHKVRRLFYGSNPQRQNAIGRESIEGVASSGLLGFLLCSVGDLNPIFGFYFPLFSMCFPGEFPSG
jgi:hypothetical protein